MADRRAVDFGRAAGDYARHRTALPEPLLAALREAGIARPGARVLDVGAGTGRLSRALRDAGARPVAVDPSASLLAEAAPFPRARGRAEALPFRAGAFDAAAALQCWHWLDPARAAAELHRVVRPGGAVAILADDWVPLPGSLCAATEALILEHNPGWHLGDGDGRHPEFAAALRGAGFVDVATREADHDEPFTHAAWRGRIRASAGVGASLSPEGVTAFDADLGALLARDFPTEPVPAPHRSTVTWARRRA